MTTTRTGYNGSDIQTGDYVATVSDSGSQSAVLGTVVMFSVLDGNDVAFIRMGGGEVPVRISRLVRTSARMA